MAMLSPWIAAENGIIPYSYTTIDAANGGYKSPTGVHLLGTDLVGRDVFSMYLHGSRNSVITGIAVTLLAAILGLLWGFLSGYREGTHNRISLPELLVYIPIVLYLLFLLYAGVWWLFCILTVLFTLAMVTIRRMSVIRTIQLIELPLASLTMFLMQLLTSMPKLFLILLLASLFGNSFSFVLVCLGVLLSVNIGLVTRAELMRVKNSDYITAARSLGLSETQILRTHILPNIMPLLLVTLTNTAITAIVAEAGFSYLGIGLGPEDVSWGKLLAEARYNLQAWWIWLMPLLSLTALLWALNRFSVYFSNFIPNKLGDNW